MGLFDKLLGKAKEKQEKTPSSKDLIGALMVNADVAMEKGDYAIAVEMLKTIVSFEPNVRAQYNLGSLYAQGKGTGQSFLEGAYWFHQAELAGDEKAGLLCRKCIMDFIHQGFDQKTPKSIYDDMLRAVSRIYPEGNATGIAVKYLYDLADLHLDKDEIAAMAKLIRAAAEYGNHGPSQSALGFLYNVGASMEKDEQAALYWFDRAVGNHDEEAVQRRNEIFNAFKNDFSSEGFYPSVMAISQRCAVGDKDIPKDVEKAAYWKKAAKDGVLGNA